MTTTLDRPAPNARDITSAAKKASMPKRLAKAPPQGHVTHVLTWCDQDPLLYYNQEQRAVIAGQDWWLIQIDTGDPNMTFLVGTPHYTKTGKPRLNGDWMATAWVYEVEPADNLGEHKAAVGDDGITCTCGWTKKYARKPSLVYDAYAKHLAEHTTPIYDDND